MTSMKKSYPRALACLVLLLASTFPAHSFTPERNGVAKQSGVLISIKICLEGAYRNGTMDDALANAGLIPTTSPYGDGRTVSAVPTGIVDWILVQLLADIEGPVVAARSFFLRQDGYLVDPDDSGIELNLPGVEEGYYYVKIIHRNHLYVLTRDQIFLETGAAAILDCCSGASECFGINGMKELATGVWAMFCGEINGDDNVTDADFALWQQSARYGEKGYLKTDLNLDGQVTSRDYLFIYRNRKMDVRRNRHLSGESNKSE